MQRPIEVELEEEEAVSHHPMMPATVVAVALVQKGSKVQHLVEVALAVAAVRRLPAVAVAQAVAEQEQKDWVLPLLQLPLAVAVAVVVVA